MAAVTVGGTRRVTLVEAAQILGITKEAVRKRVSRGTLASDVGEDGRRYVYLDAGGDVGSDGESSATNATTNAASPGYDALIAQLRDEVAAWREEAKRKDTIIMQMAQANATLAARVPELEAAQEARGSPERSSEAASRGGEDQDDEPEQRRSSWLYRFFFGP